MLVDTNASVVVILTVTLLQGTTLLQGNVEPYKVDMPTCTPMIYEPVCLIQGMKPMPLACGLWPWYQLGAN